MKYDTTQFLGTDFNVFLWNYHFCPPKTCRGFWKTRITQTSNIFWRKIVQIFTALSSSHHSSWITWYGTDRTRSDVWQLWKWRISWKDFFFTRTVIWFTWRDLWYTYNFLDDSLWWIPDHQICQFGNVEIMLIATQFVQK